MMTVLKRLWEVIGLNRVSGGPKDFAETSLPASDSYETESENLRKRPVNDLSHLKHGEQIPMFKEMPQVEKSEERQIIDLYEQVGCIIIKFSQAQKAQQTAGIADLLILCPKLETSWWHEVKRRSGPQYKKVNSKQSAAQKIFQDNVEMVGMLYIIGPLSTAQGQCRRLGLIL